MARFVLDARTVTEHFPGIGRYVMNLAQAISRRLDKNEQLLLLRDPATGSRWQLPPPSRQVVHVDAAVSPFSLSQQWQIPRLLQKHAAHVYHSPFYLMPYRPGIPTLVTIYDLTPQLFPATASLRARTFFRFTTRLALFAADHIATVSEATRDDLLASYPLSAAKVTVTPLAPDPLFQPQPASEVERIRQIYDLPAEYTLYLGINKPHKNLVKLLQAWASLETTGTLVIAGAWDDRYPQPKISAAALNLGDGVRFLGPIPNEDTPALYAGAALFVFPSLYEGFGLPVVEAMACGTAVACANSSSLPEVGGDAVHYFDPNSVTDMAAVINRLLQDEQLRLQAQMVGPLHSQRFSWAETARRTLEQYRQLAGCKSS